LYLEEGRYGRGKNPARILCEPTGHAGGEQMYGKKAQLLRCHRTRDETIGFRGLPHRGWVGFPFESGRYFNDEIIHGA
jgi:hypothetical protein